MTTTLQKGKRTDVTVISRTHGGSSFPLQQNMSITPSFTSETEHQYGDTTPVLMYTEYEDAALSFEYDAGDNKSFEAMVMDIDPASTIVVTHPDQYQPVTVLANDRSQKTNKIYQGVLIQQCVIDGYPETGSVKDKKKYTPSFKCANVHHVKGGGIQYLRIVASGSTAFSSTGDYTLPADAPYSFNLANTAVADPSTTEKVLLALLNGEPVDPDDYITSITGAAGVLKANLGATDVLEVFTPYVPA